MLGLVVAGGFEFMDDRMHSEQEIKDLMPVAIMVEIPEVLNFSDQEKSRKRADWVGRQELWWSRSWRDLRSAILRVSSSFMYKAFFNLTLNPFELTPDPEFLFVTKRHNEALAALYYGVRRHKGFVVFTGEVGTGKTLLLRCLLQLFKQSKDVAYAYVFNSRLAPTEFLQYILSDFGLSTSGKNKSELLFSSANS